MEGLDDNESIKELKKRFQEKNKALYDLRALTRKLEAVNKKLQESEALKSNFLSNIRNEINNPLTAIMGLSKQLISPGEQLDSETVLTVANMIHSESFNLDFQLRNIFAAAEIEAGENELGISKVNICKLILDTIEVFSHKSGEKKVSIRFFNECSDDTGNEFFFRTDSLKLNVILYNLLSNSIEYSSENGSVDLKAYLTDGHLNISVADTGEGLDKSEQELIFDRFKQLDTGTMKSHRGHGLGLSVTKSLIEFLNGTIAVSSNRCQGSIFTVTIPESDQEVDALSVVSNEFLFEEERF
jgi:signal transduction histidine kinase